MPYPPLLTVPPFRQPIYPGFCTDTYCAWVSGVGMPGACTFQGGGPIPTPQCDSGGYTPSPTNLYSPSPCVSQP